MVSVTLEIMAGYINPRFPHKCVITRIEKNKNPLEDGDKVTIIHKGECRSYPYNIVSDKGEVITSTRKLALPTPQQGWTEENVPQIGDEVEVKRLTYKERGRVIDVQDGNLGTTLLWRKY